MYVDELHACYHMYKLNIYSQVCETICRVNVYFTLIEQIILYNFTLWVWRLESTKHNLPLILQFVLRHKYFNYTYL